ncbi:hypothetical protein Bbelb_145850 [Branchiostoma belcheri]|nr:hypothetical protein Bbelb_145850 [Branchiostoma belcheri]
MGRPASRGSVGKCHHRRRDDTLRSLLPSRLLSKSITRQPAQVISHRVPEGHGNQTDACFLRIIEIPTADDVGKRRTLLRYYGNGVTSRGEGGLDRRVSRETFLGGMSALIPKSWPVWALVTVRIPDDSPRSLIDFSPVMSSHQDGLSIQF